MVRDFALISKNYGKITTDPREIKGNSIKVSIISQHLIKIKNYFLIFPLPKF